MHSHPPPPPPKMYREQSGTDSGCGVLEVNQGDECAAVKVYPGKVRA